MKKTIKSLLAIAITAFAFTACSDVPEPYQIPGTGGGSGGGGEISGATGTGQLTDPYNCVAAINTGGTTDWVYIKGKVCEVKEEYTTQYGNGTFYISDDGTKTNKFYVYRAYYLGNKKFADGDTQIKVGDDVIVCGIITNYNGTIETTQNKGFIYELNGVNRGGDPTGGGGEGGEKKGTGTEADPFNVAAAVAKCKEVGQTASTESYYIKGIANADYTVDQYKNVTVDIVDTEGASEKFTVYRVKDKDGKGIKEGYKIAKGATLVVYGKIVNYKGNTPETVQNEAYLVSVNGQAPEVEGGSGGDTPDPGEAKGSGTLADPYNIAAIIKYTTELGADVESTGEVYFKGKISQVKNKYVADDYGNATFYVSEDGTTNNEFYCFRTLYLGNTKFAGGTKNINVGDEVIICGKVVNYKGNTPETVGNKSYLYSLNGKTEAEADGGGGEQGGGGASAADGTITIADFGLENAAELTTLKTSDGIELVFAQEDGSNAPKYYTTGASARMYAKNSLTIKATKAMTKVVLTCTDNNGKAANGNAEMYGEAGGNKVTTTKDSDTQVTFSGFNNSTLKIVNDYTDVKSGTQLRIASIAITYAE